MTPPSPCRATSGGVTLMSLPCKGKVKIINVGPIDGLAGGHGGFRCRFLEERSPKDIMNSYSRRRPKRKTAWELSQWKGWSKSADLSLAPSPYLFSSTSLSLFCSVSLCPSQWFTLTQTNELILRSVSVSFSVASPSPHLWKCDTILDQVSASSFDSQVSNP